MSKGQFGRVYITEKPKVAKALAEYLGIEERVTKGKYDGYYRVRGGDAVTWLVGHLLENAPPEAYLSPEQHGFGRTDVLPIIPADWKSEAKTDTKGQLAVVVDLIKKSDEIWNCGDIDREGQLVSDEVIEYAGVDPAGGRKPVRRVLLVGLNDKEIERALKGVRSNGEAEFLQRRNAAQCRQKSDWLIGMNGSRAYSGKANRVISVGRVQTPTLALVVERDREIENFKPKDFYRVKVRLGDGRVLEWQGRKTDHPGIDPEGRIVDKALAEEIAARIRAGLAGQVAKAQRKEVEQAPPKPFSLSKLQTALTSRFGMSVKLSTKVCQGLYENKLITYIGTDCEYLPESQHGESKEVMSGIAQLYGQAVRGADLAIKHACWNDGKVTAHHAIIPTGVTPSNLTDEERKVYDTVALQYLAQFYPNHRYASNVLEVDFGEDTFAANWQEPLVMGWKTVLGSKDNSGETHDAERDLDTEREGERR